MNSLRSPNGAALIEALVGGIIIAVIVIAVFQVLSEGSSINQKELLRRQAYQELERVLESPEYSYRSPNYLNLAVGTNLVSGYPKTVTLDTRGTSGTSDDVTGTISVRVAPQTYTYSGTTIPAKRIIATITYKEDGVDRTETLETIITLVSIN